MWEDEAHLALNFIDGGYLEMFMPLKNFQSAPIVFLLGVETMSNIFGYSEMALRLFPFLISLLIYPLFYFFVRDMTGNRLTALTAFIFLSFNAYIIQYATELKPYTVEMSAVIGLGYLVFSTHPYVAARRERLLKLSGSIALFTANTSFIILFVVVCYRVLLLRKIGKSVATEEYATAKKVNKRLFTTWGIAFAACIILNIIINPYADNMRELWKPEFIPMNIFSGEFFAFMQQRAGNILFSTVFMIADIPGAAWLLAAILVAGVVYMATTRRYHVLLFCVGPVLVHCFLSWAQLYPLFDRFVLYLTPSMYIWLAASVVFVAEALAEKLPGIVAATWSAGIFAFALYPSTQKFPLVERDVKPCLGFLNRYPADMKLYTTAPKTLYEYYLKTGHVHNITREEVLSGLTMEQYNTQVGDRPDGYMMLYAAAPWDASAHIITNLDSAGLIRDRFEYGSYGVIVVGGSK